MLCVCVCVCVVCVCGCCVCCVCVCVCFTPNVVAVILTQISKAVSDFMLTRNLRKGLLHSHKNMC